MRLMHISDLHLGKRLHETDMSADLEHALFNEALGRIYDEVTAEAPDKPIEALLITGDVYDRSLPSAEAEDMFGRLLAEAFGKKMKVFCISGNHDSARRLAANEQLFSRLGLYISREFTSDDPVRVEQLGDFDVAMLPFVSLADVHAAYPNEIIPDMTSAITAVLKHAGLPGTRPCILAAHQAVSKDGNSVIGMQQTVKSDVFSGFVYTALGHIHTPADVGKNVRYCGSPVCFSGSEAKNPQKYVDIIDIETDGSCEVQHREIIPLHNFSILNDSFAALMSDKYPSTEDYCYITVSETDAVTGVAQQLREKFVNMLKLSYAGDGSSPDDPDRDDPDNDDFSFTGEFARFCADFKHSTDDILLKSAEDIFDRTAKAFAEGSIDKLIHDEPELIFPDENEQAAENGQDTTGGDENDDQNS